MAGNEYTAADITVLEFDEVVRKRPEMYFGVGLNDPRLPTALLCAVAGHALHPAAGVAREHTLRTVIEVFDDLGFTVAMDQVHAWGGADSPALGYYGSLLGPEWWLPAAVAALCESVTVEMWSDGRGFRQELAGIRPLAEPWEIDAPVGSGTRIVFVLDPGRLGRGAAFPTDHLELHDPDCGAPKGPGHVIVRDRRRANPGQEAFYK
ncbi:hypothetical protein GCM10009555_007790 [Acrocarpospora macrocephala]|uniref:Uncharacterized protein n=1 Tax=Acrocarpospora macrocephala TaxID=150177 RepID=A0A5M3WUC0_9ACTN|nr:hypothetical protein [Acrocarpospora macrocephala]GES12985.1 hypothetical protein Amac_065820 [Acrocarpospora macrocephala]